MKQPSIIKQPIHEVWSHLGDGYFLIHTEQSPMGLVREGNARKGGEVFLSTREKEYCKSYYAKGSEKITGPFESISAAVRYRSGAGRVECVGEIQDAMEGRR